MLFKETSDLCDWGTLYSVSQLVGPDQRPAFSFHYGCSQ